MMVNRPEDQSDAALRARRADRGEPGDVAPSPAPFLVHKARRLVVALSCAAAMIAWHREHLFASLEASSPASAVPAAASPPGAARTREDSASRPSRGAAGVPSPDATGAGGAAEKEGRASGDEATRPSEEASEESANNESNARRSNRNSAALSNNESAGEVNDDRDGKEDAHELSIEPKWIDHLKSLPDFPKIVHITWPDKNVLNTTFQMIQHGMGNLQRLNPDWKIMVHDDNDIRDTLRNFDYSGLPNSTRADLAAAHIVEKTDAFRLMRVYETGGLHVDIDRVANKRLSDAIHPTTRLVVPTYYDISFAQDLFGSSPGNKLLWNVLQRQSRRRARLARRRGWIRSGDVMELCKIYSTSLEADLFGRQLTGEDGPVWDEVRHVLARHAAGTVVTKKDVWCNGLLISDYPECKMVQREPLYEAYNVTHWVDEVDALWK